MERFLQGDRVRLKSGGPEMRITALRASSGWTMWCADAVACRWFERAKQQDSVFDVALLEKVSSRGEPRHHRLQQPGVLVHEPHAAHSPS
ncbi:MAG TPA: DUF2158 domain-containing protein [Candidatus Tectomicrobia bacterium]